MKKTLFSEIDRVLPKLVKMRRDLHAHPEIAFEEVRTAEVASRYFKTVGLEVTRGVAKTGVVALLRGALPGPTLAIRAELDAVPIQERGDFPHASKKPGIMHACGHDGHLAIALGTAKILSLMKDRLRGNVKFILQPADEGRGGAREMLKAGVLQESPRIEAILGIHSSPEVPLGKVALMDGKSVLIDSFKIRIQGRGGHPAFPQTVIDPIFLSAQVINGLQSLKGRFGGSAIILSTIQGGGAPNVIPDSVEIHGTIQIENSGHREDLRRALESIVAGVCGAYGGRCQVSYEDGTSMPRQDVDFAGHISSGAAMLWGPDHLQNLGYPAPGTEELSPFLEHVPGAMCLLGLTPEGTEGTPLHSPYFDFNDQALAHGIQIAVVTTFHYLNGNNLSL